MSNLIPLEDAARMLGLTVDKLNELRSNSEIFGYKDGASWKFKMQELERVADEFDIKINPNATDAVDEIVDLVDDDEFDLKLDSDDEMDINLDDDSVVDLNLDDEPVVEAAKEDDVVSLDDDDDFAIDLEDSAEDVLDLNTEESAIDLNLDDEPVVEAKPAALDDEVVSLDDDDDFEIDLEESAEDVLELNTEESAIDLDLDEEPVVEAGKEDDVVSLDADDDFEIDLEESAEDVLELNTEEPAVDLSLDDEPALDLGDDEPVLNLDDAEPALDLDVEEPMFDLDLDDDPVAEAEEKVSAMAEDAADKIGLSGELDLGVDDEVDLSLDDSGESILGGLGTAAAAAAAGVAGLAGAAASAGGADDDDDDFVLNESGELDLDADSGELLLSDDAIDLDNDDLEVAADKPEELSFGSSDIELAADDAKDDDLSLSDSSDLLLDDEPSKGDPSTGKIMNDADDQASDLMLSEDDLFSDDLEIQDSNDDSLDLGSDLQDSDLIMDDSDSSAADDDSGFLLSDDDSEVDLSGGLMDLAGVDEDGADEMIVLDDAADFDAPTDIAADDDFNLTPLEEVIEAEESGSQVIALEDSEMYSDDSAATLLSPGDEMESPTMLEEDSLDMGDFGGGFDAGMAAPGMAVATAGSGTLPEQPYTVWQVASLGLVLFLLLVGGMVGYDLARNLWLPEDRVISAGVLPMIRSLLGG